MTADDVQANEATIANIRLWRPSVLKENFESVQRIRQYYDFADVDVDRYEIDGERRVLMVSGREVIGRAASARRRAPGRTSTSCTRTGSGPSPPR